MISESVSVGRQAVPRIRVRRVSEIPAGAVRVFGRVPWRNPYRYRSSRGLARIPAVHGEGQWEYEGRVSAAGMRHDYWHPGGEVTVCHIRYMTRRECQDTYRRVLTGDLTPALERHHLQVSLPEVVETLKGKTLACTCPFPAAGQPDWCHAAVLADLAAACTAVRLTCVTSEAASAVAAETDRPGTNRAAASGQYVLIAYTDKRYPLDIAEWAVVNQYAHDSAAAAVIAGL